MYLNWVFELVALGTLDLKAHLNRAVEQENRDPVDLEQPQHPAPGKGLQRLTVRDDVSPPVAEPGLLTVPRKLSILSRTATAHATLRAGGVDTATKSNRGPITVDAVHLKPEFLITDSQDLRALFPPTHPMAIQKCLDHLDRHATDFITRSPFLCIGTQSADGTADVSPRGDPRGFVKVLDDKTLLIPDRPGNNRLDTLANILENPAVGLLFLVPGFDDTMRVNGTARLTRDPELLSLMAVNDRHPQVAIVVSVSEVFIHCAKAFRRARLWDQSQHQDRAEMPSLLKIILDQSTGAPQDPAEMAKIDAGLEEDYKRTMY